MDKYQILKNIKNKEDRMIISNIIDKYEKNKKTGINTSTNFCDEKIISIINKTKIPYQSIKPHEYCNKEVIYFGNEENYITIYKIYGKFKHNEILGTLFSLGLDHYTIGDIIVEEDYFYLTNLTRLNNIIETGLYEINKTRIKKEIVNEIIVTKNRFAEFNIIVPSYRLDCIVSKLGCMGRNESQKYIEDGLVLLNYNEANYKRIVKKGDIISIRKNGKYIIDEELQKTKKDNIVLSIKKYN